MSTNKVFLQAHYTVTASSDPSAPSTTILLKCHHCGKEYTSKRGWGSVAPALHHLKSSHGIEKGIDADGNSAVDLRGWHAKLQQEAIPAVASTAPLQRQSPPPPAGGCGIHLPVEQQLQPELASSKAHPTTMPQKEPESRLSAPCPFDSPQDLPVAALEQPPSRRGSLLLHPQLHTVIFSYLDPMFVIRVVRLVSSAMSRVGAHWVVEESLQCAHPDGHVVLSAEGVEQLQQVFWAFNIFNAEAFVARRPQKPNLHFVGCAFQVDVLNPVLELPATLLRAMVRSHNPGVRFRCVRALRKVLSVEHNAPIDEVINIGVLPDLVKIVGRDVTYPQLQAEAAWALTNIASGSQPHTQAVVDAGALEVLARGLGSPDKELSEQCVWALGNIAGDSPAMRDAVLKVGVVPQLSQSLMAFHRHIAYARNAVWAVSNLVRGSPPPPLDQIEPLIPLLIWALGMNDEEVTTDVFWGLSYLADAIPGDHPTLFGSSVFDTLHTYLSNPSQPHGALTAAIKFVGNGCKRHSSIVDRFIASDCLRPYAGCLHHAKQNIHKETLCGLSNITAGNPAQIDAVVQTGCMPKVIELARTARSDVAKEALCVLTNTCSGGKPETVKCLVGLRVIIAFIVGLGSSDASAVAVALGGLHHIARVFANQEEKRSAFERYEQSLIEALEPLLMHPLHGKLAEEVIERLGLSVDEEEDE